MPKEPGPYVLKVDYLDRDGGAYPKNQLATHAVLLKVQKEPPPLGKPKAKSGAAAYEVLFAEVINPGLRINDPTSGDKFGTAANIPMAGTCDNKTVVTVRLRATQCGVIVQRGNSESR